MRQELIESVKKVVKEEREAAASIHPLFHSTHEGYAVILEELDEARDALCNIELQQRRLWDNVKKDNFPSRDQSFVEVGYLEKAAINLACEAIQIAAMAEKFIESVKR